MEIIEYILKYSKILLIVPVTEAHYPTNICS